MNQNVTVNQITSIQIPTRIGLLGYGAIGQPFVEMLLKDYPDANLVVVDMVELNYKEVRFEYIPFKVTQENIKNLMKIMRLKKGDFLVDLSCDISSYDLIVLCEENGILLINSASEVWEDSGILVSYPKSSEECYNLSLIKMRNEIQKMPRYQSKKGTTCILQMGMNPGLISTCVKKGLEDAAKFFLQDCNSSDINKYHLEKWLTLNNYSKIAQTLGVSTIHCSEIDDQVLEITPVNLPYGFHNTWSCRGFLSEGLTPIQVARGSHEDKSFENFTLIANDTVIMSNKPSVLTWAKSWVPNQNIKGVLIPHSESNSLRAFLYDHETGYAISQYYVYDYNPYAKVFVMSLPDGVTLQETNPEQFVMSPKQYPSLRGFDKCGALLIMKNNRGWWTGTIMDDIDARDIFNFQFGPTALQVAAGTYAGFLWGCANPDAGIRFPEDMDSEFLLEKARPYLGRWISTYVDLSKTCLKDCYKIQDFLIQPPEIPKFS